MVSENSSLDKKGRSVVLKWIPFIARPFLIVFNLIFVFFGIGLLMAGVISMTHLRSYVRTLGPDLSVVPVLFAALGCVVILVSVMGVLGGITMNSFVLACYSGLMLVLIFGELALGFVTMKEQQSVENETKIRVMKAMAFYNFQQASKITVDAIQKWLKCCGIVDYRDWITVLGKSEVPASCCVTPGNCQRMYNLTDSNKPPFGVRTNGCRTALNTWMRNNMGKVTFVVLLLCGLQILGVVLGVLLVCSTKMKWMSEEKDLK
ncbi:unnamed protein product [Calicophoron daubneyi]|uniref:Tetraspanin n=1 Tax=Calicophoron daubneyi TaxID=300641 RepID=A0AAV2T236_CALDB